MLDSILVPLDGSSVAEGVLPHLVGIAQPLQSQITILCVVEQDQTTDSVDPLNWQIRKTEASVYLDGISTQLKEIGLPTQTVIQEGPPADRIVGFAQSHNSNLIAMSSRGRTGLSSWGVSSVVQKIIMSAPTSLLMVKAQTPGRDKLTAHQYKRILVALDGSLRAECVLPVVIPLAHFHKAQVHVVHVVRKPEMARRTPPNREDIELADRIVERNREEAVRYLEQLPEKLPLEGLDLHTHLLTHDSPALALHEFVTRENIDMVMLSAHGYSGSNLWPYGNMTTNFIFYSQVPLLIVQDLPADRGEMTQTDVAVRDHPGY